MGYRIVYQHGRKDLHKNENPRRRMVLTALFFGVFLLGTAAYWPEGRQALREILFSGTQQAAKAWEHLAVELENGIPVRQAAAAFGHQIWEGVRYAPD